MVNESYNPHMRRATPIRAGALWAGTFIGCVAAYACYRGAIFVWGKPYPKTMSREWRNSVLQRRVEQNADPISSHKIGQKVPYDI